MPRFNRERRVIELLQGGRAVLLFKSWDNAGVLSAGRQFADALEHPAHMEWDAKPPDVDRWNERAHLESLMRVQ